MNSPDIRHVGVRVGVWKAALGSVCTWTVGLRSAYSWGGMPSSPAMRTDRKSCCLLFYLLVIPLEEAGLLSLKLPVCTLLSNPGVLGCFVLFRARLISPGPRHWVLCWVLSPCQLLPLERVCCTPNTAASAETQLCCLGSSWPGARHSSPVLPPH